WPPRGAFELHKTPKPQKKGEALPAAILRSSVAGRLLRGASPGCRKSRGPCCLRHGSNAPEFRAAATRRDGREKEGRHQTRTRWCVPFPELAGKHPGERL